MYIFFPQSQELPVHNACALMGMLITVDSRPTRLSEKSIIKLGNIVLSYMIDVALVSVDFVSLLVLIQPRRFNVICMHMCWFLHLWAYNSKWY